MKLHSFDQAQQYTPAPRTWKAEAGEWLGLLCSEILSKNKQISKQQKQGFLFLWVKHI